MCVDLLWEPMVGVIGRPLRIDDHCLALALGVGTVDFRSCRATRLYQRHVSLLSADICGRGLRGGGAKDRFELDIGLVKDVTNFLADKLKTVVHSGQNELVIVGQCVPSTLSEFVHITQLAQVPCSLTGYSQCPPAGC